MDVAIIDYKMGNLHSVQAACDYIGLKSIITQDPNIILNANAAILPGVGAFGEAITQLRDSSLDKCIYKFIETGKPFLGICLGLQLLFESSEEFGAHSGLGIIKGKIKKFEFHNSTIVKYPVPQIGWNKIMQGSVSWDKSLLCGNKDGDFMYFVHSFYAEPKDDNVTLSLSKYGENTYCSSIMKDNVTATQFHPEKSGTVGMTIYQQIKNKINNGNIL